MMSTHAGFILAAYLFTLAVVGGAALVLVLDHRSLRRALAQLPPREGDDARS